VESYRRIEVKPIAGALGAEIASVDLGILDDETFKEIEAAWLEHQGWNGQARSPADG
jgi:alpha-ketoglutarate-dependent taurine dioxygenase